MGILFILLVIVLRDVLNQIMLALYYSFLEQLSEFIIIYEQSGSDLTDLSYDILNVDPLCPPS